MFPFLFINIVYNIFIIYIFLKYVFDDDVCCKSIYSFEYHINFEKDANNYYIFMHESQIQVLFGK